MAQTPLCSDPKESNSAPLRLFHPHRQLGFAQPSGEVIDQSSSAGTRSLHADRRARPASGFVAEALEAQDPSRSDGRPIYPARPGHAPGPAASQGPDFPTTTMKKSTLGHVPLPSPAEVSTPCPGDRYTPPCEVSLVRHRVPGGAYLASDDQKTTLAEQIRLARREVPQGEYHA
jgi:hypothetical protein